MKGASFMKGVNETSVAAISATSNHTAEAISNPTAGVAVVAVDIAAAGTETIDKPISLW